jgi:hypothetical protein
VECKKNNPEFVNWVLFPKQHKSETDSFFTHDIRTTPPPDQNHGWRVQHSFDRKTHDVVIADEARETRATYADYKRGDKAKTSNSAIADAARQVALATQAIVTEELDRPRRLGWLAPGQPIIPLRHNFVPAIVTTARLLTCRFAPEDVNAKTGEIEFAKATLEEVPFLIYEYPLPRTLQFDPDDHSYGIGTGNSPPEFFTKMHIVIIQSESLSELLPELPAKLNNLA